MGWSDRILGGESPDREQGATPEEKKPVKWSDMMTGGPNSTGLSGQPLNSVFTDISPGGQGASFGTQAEAGMVDDVGTQIKIYAATRFPDMPEEERIKRYGVHKGEIVYSGDDGKLYHETPDTWGQRFKRLIAQGVVNPSTILSIVGSAAGPKGTIAGATVGEAGRKAIGKYVYDEPQTVEENIKDVAVSGAMAGVGEVAGRGAVGLVNKLGAKRGGIIAESAGRDRATVSIPEVARLENASKQFGIDLLPPSTTGSKRLADKWKLLGDLPDTADTISMALKKTTAQVEDSFYNQLNKIAKPTSTIEAGSGLVDASKKATNSILKVRKEASKPFYDKARARNVDVDISAPEQGGKQSLVDWVESGIDSAKADIRKAYQDIQKILYKPDLPKEKGGYTSKILNESGEPAIKIDSVLAYDTKLDGLDNSLKALSQRVSTNKNQYGELTPVGKIYDDARRMLRSKLREADPDYAKGMDLYREGSEFADELLQGTLISGVANLKGDKRVKALRMMFAAEEATPETVAQARKLIVDGMGKRDEWYKAVRAEMQGQFEKIRKDLASSDIQNIGGLASKKMWGNRERSIFEAAAPELVENFDAFFEVLDRTKLIFGKESMTFPRSVIADELRREGGSTLLNAGETIASPSKLMNVGGSLFARANEALRGKHNKALAEAMTSEKAAQQLKSMLQLPPGSAELSGKFAAFMAMVGSGAFGNELERSELSEKEESLGKRKEHLPWPFQPPLESRVRPQ